MNKLVRAFAAFAVTVPILMAGLSGTASAMVKYDPNGTPTTKTPVFNQFFDVPDGVGNEADFVRIRPEGAPGTSLTTNLSAACHDGDEFNVWNYIHNGADPNFNNNGTGSAVAHDVHIHMTAPLGSTSNAFPFGATISANNADSVSATAHLNCGQNVTLSLVSGSVHYVTVAHGNVAAPDSAVNGDLTIDGHTAGQPDVWACWEERVVVYYDVKVTVKPTPPPVSTGECKVTDVTETGGRGVHAKVNAGNLQNATVVAYRINFGDGTVVDKQEADHTYANDGTFTIVGQVEIKFADGHTEWKTAQDCAKQVTFKNNTPVTPPVTPSTPVSPTPTTLVNTGAGSVAGIFAATSLIGAAAYRFVIARRLGRQ